MLRYLRSSPVRLSGLIRDSWRVGPNSYSNGRITKLYVRSVVTTSGDGEDVRKRLTTELKNAMKAKDTFSSTVLRSVLAEVYAADKNPSGPVSNSQVTSILRKAIARRSDSAGKFAVASRPDLAEAEKREANYLETFLPPSMSESDIDALLHKLATEQNLNTPGSDPKRAMGLLLRAFFGQVDKAHVDGQIVKERAQIVLGASQRN